MILICQFNFQFFLFLEIYSCIFCFVLIISPQLLSSVGFTIFLSQLSSCLRKQFCKIISLIFCRQHQQLNILFLFFYFHYTSFICFIRKSDSLNTTKFPETEVLITSLVLYRERIQENQKVILIIHRYPYTQGKKTLKPKKSS